MNYYRLKKESILPEYKHLSSLIFIIEHVEYQNIVDFAHCKVINHEKFNISYRFTRNTSNTDYKSSATKYSKNELHGAKFKFNEDNLELITDEKNSVKNH